MSNRVYVCDECKAKGVKLYREYQTFSDDTALLCYGCACKKERKDPVPMAARGNGKTLTQMGWMIAAVPTNFAEAETGKLVDTFWGYTSVPPDACNWWYGLPWSVPNE